jgi:hypothetical protein
MRAKSLLLALTALLAVARPAGAAEPLKTVVLEALDAPTSGLPGSRLRLSPEVFSDPVRRGRLLAQLLAADLVVPVGDIATTFVASEIEEGKVFFVGATQLPGTFLQREDVGGVLAYSPAEVVAVVDKSLPDAVLAVAYTPGYEAILSEIHAAASARGLKVADVRIRSRKDVPSALRTLGPDVGVLWVLGDPEINRGAAFDYIVDFCLRHQLPLVGTGAWEVQHGALMGHESDAKAYVAKAFPIVASLTARAAMPQPAVQSGPDSGRILLHPALQKRYGFDVGGRPVLELR